MFCHSFTAWLDNLVVCYKMRYSYTVVVALCNVIIDAECKKKYDEGAITYYHDNDDGNMSAL